MEVILENRKEFVRFKMYFINLMKKSSTKNRIVRHLLKILINYKIK